MDAIPCSPECQRYLKVLGGLYVVALIVQGYLAFDLLMNLSDGEITSTSEVYLRVMVPAVLYPITAWALWFEKSFRVLLFHIVATSQVVFFLTVGRDSADNWAFGFHVLSLVLYWKFVAREKRRRLEEEAMRRGSKDV